MHSQDSSIEGSDSWSATDKPDQFVGQSGTPPQRPENPPPVNAEWQASPPPMSRRVVLKFYDRFDSYDDDQQQNLPEDLQEQLRSLQADYPALRFTTLYGAIETGLLEELSNRRGRVDEDYQSPDFLTYYAVELPSDDESGSAAELGNQIAEMFSSSGLVESAYVELPPGPQPCDTAIHHDPAPDSLGTSIARGQPGGDGAGARLLDLERVWDTPPHPDLGHVNLASATPPETGYPAKYNYHEDRQHAAAVAGIIASRGEGVGCLGIAPAAEMWLGSTWQLQPSGQWIENQAAAILGAIPFLNIGDVLLLEMQIYDENDVLAPVELNNAAFEAIRQATADGIIVIEPAGNGGALLTNLAPSPDLAGAANRFQSGEHSGAVFVAATIAPGPGGPHWRQDESNFGDRIDCHAWGEMIDTLDALDHATTLSFGLTSGASAMIAGAALVVQGMRLANQQPPLTPPQMADLLRSGTPMEPPAAIHGASEQIAAMPDLITIHSHL